MIEVNRKEIIIRKPSAMIQTNAKELTLHQRKIINYLIHAVQHSGDQKSYSIYLKDLKKACGISTKGNEELKANIKKLTETVIEFNVFEKDSEIWEINVLLSGAKVEFKTGIVTFAFSPFIQERIIKPLIYSPLKLLTIASFKCSYSVVLYEFLRDYLTSPHIPYLTIHQLKTLLGVDDEKYPEFKYFKREILDKAIKEINTLSELNCSFTLVNDYGKKYVGIKFKVKEKNDSKNTDEFSKVISNAENDDELLCSKISEILKIKIDRVFELLIRYGKERIKEVYNYTKDRATTNPGGFFLKALEENYDLPQEDLVFEKEKEKSSLLETKKCFNSFGNFGNCGSTWERALKERNTKSCFWCQKYDKHRKDLKKKEEEGLNIQ